MPFVLALFLIVALVIAILVAGSVILAIRARAVTVALSVLGGLGTSALLAGGGGPTLLTSLIAGLALFIAIETISRPAAKRRRDRARYDIEVTPTPAKAPLQRRSPKAATPAAVDPTLDSAFSALAQHADWAAARVAVARESCQRFLAALARAGFDSDAADLAIKIRKRIPEHVSECLDRADLATPSERRAILDDCVFTAEQVAAEAERQRQRLLGALNAEMEVQRRHLTRPAPRDPFSID